MGDRQPASTVTNRSQGRQRDRLQDTTSIEARKQRVFFLAVETTNHYTDERISDANMKASQSR